MPDNIRPNTSGHFPVSRIAAHANHWKQWLGREVAAVAHGRTRGMAGQPMSNRTKTAAAELHLDDGQDQNTYQGDPIHMNATDTMAQAADICSIAGCNSERHGRQEFDWHTASAEDGEAWQVTVDLFETEQDNVWRVYGELKEHTGYHETGGLWVTDVEEFTAAYYRGFVLATELNTKLQGVAR